MNFENLFKNYDKLIQHMKGAGYSESYISLLKTEITWLQKNEGNVNSYEDACQMRQSHTKSPEMHRRYRLEYGILKRFDLSNIYWLLQKRSAYGGKDSGLI